MLYELELPAPPGGVPTLEIERWHKRVGDTVAFGDLLCELKVLEKQNLRRWLAEDAPKPSLFQRVLGYTHQPRHRSVQVIGLSYLLRASDTGILRKTVAPLGSVVSPGDVLAVLTSEGDEPLETTADPVRFRVVGDYRRDTEPLEEDEYS